eukprot:gene8800-9704_t
MKVWWLAIVLFSRWFEVCGSSPSHLHCRDPDLGAHRYQHLAKRTFLMVTGSGAGIGNFLVFFPAAYYFAMLTGRDILLQDGSLIGEMCRVVRCGFPHYSDYAKAFPGVLSPSDMGKARGVKAGNFAQHLHGQAVIEDTIVSAYGFRIQSGWYLGHNFSEACLAKRTGCGREDLSCHDRYALQQLIRGPFLPAYQSLQGEGYRLVGAPVNLIQGLLTLPHMVAPRFDVAVHLRCQFKHFEILVGPDDGAAWLEYEKEVNDFLSSSDPRHGKALFRILKEKILSEAKPIVQQRRLSEGRNSSVSTLAPYAFDPHDPRVFVFIASDNSRVKEAFAEYLQEDGNITVLRVQQDLVVHAKNVAYLKDSLGVFPLAMDWYSLSLANNILAYRRDTHLLSTFAHSAERMSGNLVLEDEDLLTVVGAEGKATERSKGWQLIFKGDHPRWAEF